MRVNKRLFGLFILLFAASISIAQVNVFTESFDEINGSVAGTSAEGVLWSAFCPGCLPGDYYEVVNGSFENNDSNGAATWTTSPFDISTCTRLVFTVDYSGSPYGPDLESNTDCAGCSGNPIDAASLDCFNCWDFMEFSILLDAGPTQMELIGTTNTPTSASLMYEMEECAGFGDNASLRITSSTWAGSEFMRFDNVALVCYMDGGPTATLTGGATLCGNECTTVDWEIMDGTAPYDLDFTFTSGGFDIDFPLDGQGATGTLNVCLDNSLPFPIYDIASNTLFINDAFANSSSLELTSVEDDAGCIVNLTGQIAQFMVSDPPTISDISDISVCTGDNGMATVDLSLYENDVNGGNGDLVTWYDDVLLTNEISNVITISMGQFVYATATDAFGCESAPIEIEIVLTLSPIITPLQNQSACNEYTLPPITGSNLTGSESYYSAPDGGGVPFSPGTVIASDMVFYIYAENGTCSDEEFFTVTILPSPDLSPVQNVTSCGSYTLPPILGTGLSGNERYFAQPGGTGVSYLPGEIITTSTVLYIYDTNGDCSDELFFFITITEGPSLNMPFILESCGSVILPVIMGDNLSGNEAYFTEMNGMGVMYMPGDIITSTILLYVYDVSGNCMAEVSININVSDGPAIDPIFDQDACSFYILPAITGQSLNDPQYISDNGVQYEAGDTIFQNDVIFIQDTASNDPTCFSEISFDVNIIDEVDAGQNINTNTCAGGTLDLLNLLDPSIDSDGIFDDPSNTGALVGSMLDLNLITGNAINILYILQNTCNIDTAEITINIVDLVNAGLDSTAIVCTNTLVSLSDYINDGDAGGVFVFIPSQTELTEVLTDSIAIYGGSISVNYIVGDGNACPRDTASISLTLSANPSFDLANEVIEQCSYYILPEIIGTDLSGNESYFTDADGNGAMLLEGDTIFSSSTIYLYDSNFPCPASDSFIVINSSADSLFLFETICNDDTLTVNGEQYYMGNDFGVQQLTTIDGCDSTVVINVNFFPTDTNYINQELCFGGSIVINMVTYDEDNPEGQQIYPFADMNGCDSVIVIQIEFSNAAVTPISGTICETDSIMINGNFYSVNNPAGMDTISLPSGCDSILDISFTFLEVSETIIDTFLCDGEQIFVNGTSYNAVNNVGEEIFVGGNSVGCDSTVLINITPVVVGQGLLTGEFCVGEIIDTLGESFSVDNQEMLVTLFGASAQSCDSIVLVSFDFVNTDEGLLEESICAGGSIEIEGVTYDENNTTGQFTVQTAQGCDSLVNVLITVEDVVAGVEVQDPGCNENVGYVVFGDFNISANDFTYILDANGGNAIELGDTIFNVSIGNHTLEITTDDGCSTSVNFDIEEAEEISISIPEITTIAEGASYQVDIGNVPTGMAMWSPDIEISCTMCNNPILSPTQDRVYIVEYITDQGCTASDTIEVRVNQSFDVFVPNVFSPNDDGINDRFYLSTESGGIYNMMIFDRWGNKMFDQDGLRANNQNDGWDGRFNNETLNPGVYAYYINLVYETNPDDGVVFIETREFIGSLTIIR